MQNNEALLSAGNGILGLISARNWGMWASLYSGGAMKYAGSCAVGGTTTAQILANLTTSFLTKTIPLKPRYATVLAGTNDILDGVTFTTTQANLRAIYTALRVAGIVPVLCTIPPQDAATQAQANAILQLNTWVKRMAHVNGFPFLDVYGVLVNPANGHYQAPFTTDGIHPTENGAQAIGSALWTVMTPYYSSNPLFATSQIDTLSLIPNGLFLNSAAGIPTGWIVGANATPAVAAGAGSILGNIFSLTSTAAAACNFQYNTPATVTPGDICNLTTKLLGALTSAVSAFTFQIKSNPSSAVNVFGLFAFDINILPAGAWAGLSVDFVVPPLGTDTKIRMDTTSLNAPVGDKISLAQLSLQDYTALGVLN